MKNVVTAIFDVESEAYQAFNEISSKPFGTDYVVAELALVKHEGTGVKVADFFDAADVNSDDTATGMLVGTLVGIIGGPLGMLLGASIGALAGSIVDANDTTDTLSGLEVTAGKLYEGETAIIALVQENEPAFDAAFAKYECTIIRVDADSVGDEADRAIKLEEQLAHEARVQMRAEKKAAKKAEKAEKEAKKEAKRAARQAKMDAKFAEIENKMAGREAEHEAKRAEFDEASEIAKSEFINETKKMTGEAK